MLPNNSADTPLVDFLTDNIGSDPTEPADVEEPLPDNNAPLSVPGWNLGNDEPETPDPPTAPEPLDFDVSAIIEEN